MKPLPWIVLGLLALVGAIVVARWLRSARGQGQAAVDTIITTTPAIHDSTARVLARADSAIAVSRARSDTIRRYQQRARSRNDSISVLDSLLQARAQDTTRTPLQLTQDSNTTCRQQLVLRTAESQDHQAATDVCQRDQQALRDTLLTVSARLQTVQYRADSIPLFIKLAVKAAPCRRDWGLFDVPCWLQDVGEIAGGVTLGAVIAH